MLFMFFLSNENKAKIWGQKTVLKCVTLPEAAEAPPSPCSPLNCKRKNKLLSILLAHI